MPKTFILRNNNAEKLSKIDKKLSNKSFFYFK